MAQQREVIEILERYYHPDFEISYDELYWNSGAGYFRTNCLVADGSSSFRNDTNNSHASSGVYRDFYIGNGLPGDSAVSAKAAASSLVGTGIGYVAAGAARTTVANTGNVRRSSTCWEFDREVSVNDPSMGYVSAVGDSSIKTTSANHDISFKYFTINLAGSRVPSGVVTRDGFVAHPNDGIIFLGWYKDGDKVSSDTTYVPGNADATGIEAVFAPTYKVKFYDLHSTHPGVSYKDGYSGDNRFFYVTSDVEYNVPLADTLMNHPGWRFVEWNTSEDGTGVSIADGGDVSGLYDLVDGTNTARIYAQWERIDFTLATSVAPLPDGVPQQTIQISVSPSATGDDGVSWRVGTEMSVSAPAFGNGVKFSSWNATGVTVQDQTANPLTFTMPGANVSLVANYELKPLTVTHNVDDASEYATDGQTSAYIDYGGGEQGDITDAVYGDTAVFEAPAPRPDSNFTFDGWYDASGTRVATTRTYTTVLSGDIALVAKYAIPVTIGKNEAADCKGEFSVNGTEYETQTSITLTRPLGSVLHVSATATSGYFGGWQVDGATDGETPPSPVVSDIFAEDDIVVAAIRSGSAGAYTYVDSRSYVAQFVSTAPEFTILCESVKSNEQDVGNAGTLVVTGEGVAEGTGGAYTVSGFRAVTLVTSPDATSPLPLLDVVEVFGSYPTETEESLGDVRVVRVSKNRKFRAKWGTPAKYTVSVSAEANGMAYVGDLSGVTEQIVNQGDSVTVNAVPLNGYRFDGWYVGEQRVEAGSSYTFVPTANIALQARFTEDVAAIFLWEGSDEPKRMTWTSKVYVTPRPFDPVAARVDAAGYPVDLTVRTYSSPDKADPLPVRDHALTLQNPLAVQSQDGRRLPRMRPERYLRVSVESYHEVDAVVVGTNMAEVN